MNSNHKTEKHPSIPYLDLSPSQGRLCVPATSFIGEHVTVTEKMDGELTVLYPGGYFHNRSLTKSRHWSRDLFASNAWRLSQMLRYNERGVFENLTATHTIEYKDLDGFFCLLYIVRGDTVLSYRETRKIAVANDIPMPNLLFSGVMRSVGDFRSIKAFREGYVVRYSGTFPYMKLGNFSAKYVKKDFVQSDIHWSLAPMTMNSLKEERHRRYG